MRITVQNILSGAMNTLDIPITEEQFFRWQEGELIQNVAPELDVELREFLISGFLPGDFDKVFSLRETSKSITFNKEAQDALPQHIKDKMKADRINSEKINCCFCNIEVLKLEAEAILDENWNKTGEYQCKKCWSDNINV